MTRIEITATTSNWGLARHLNYFTYSYGIHSRCVFTLLFQMKTVKKIKKKKPKSWEEHITEWGSTHPALCGCKNLGEISQHSRKRKRRRRDIMIWDKTWGCYSLKPGHINMCSTLSTKKRDILMGNEGNWRKHHSAFKLENVFWDWTNHKIFHREGRAIRKQLYYSEKWLRVRQTVHIGSVTKGKLSIDAACRSQVQRDRKGNGLGLCRHGHGQGPNPQFLFYTNGSKQLPTRTTLRASLNTQLSVRVCLRWGRGIDMLK